MNNYERYQTFVVQESAKKDGPISPPIVGSASFAYGSPQNAEAIFAGELDRPLYARMGNPTNTLLETLIAGIDEATGSIVASSGMGAIAMVATSMLQAGDEVACVGGLFGGSYALFSQTLPRFDIHARFYKVSQTPQITPKTKMIYCESVGNPNMQIPDFELLADLAKTHGILFVVDNTLTPLLFNPLKHGADMAVYSTTKILSGHSQALGGAINFNSSRSELFSSYPFLKPFYEKLGGKAFAGALKKRALRDFGMSQDAYESYLTILGLQTLPWRIRRVSESARILAKWFDERVKVIWPKEIPRFMDGIGPMFAIDLGSKKRAFQFLERVRLPFITANLGDARTLALHMQSTIYRDFEPDQLEFLGITEGLIRISVGLESVDDLIEDFDNALKGLL